MMKHHESLSASTRSEESDAEKTVFRLVVASVLRTMVHTFYNRETSRLAKSARGIAEEPRIVMARAFCFARFLMSSVSCRDPGVNVRSNGWGISADPLSQKREDTEGRVI
jgi:hypothetical protein